MAARVASEAGGGDSNYMDGFGVVGKAERPAKKAERAVSRFAEQPVVLILEAYRRLFPLPSLSRLPGQKQGRVAGQYWRTKDFDLLERTRLMTNLPG